MFGIGILVFSTVTVLVTLSGVFRTIMKTKPTNEICFDGLGCLNNGYPWRSIVRPVPPSEPPEKIAPFLLFFSRQNTEEPFIIKIYPDIDMGKTPFDSRRPTLVIFHGLTRRASTHLMQPIKDVYLQNIDANVFMVDYSGTGTLPSLQFIGNSRLMSRIVTRFLRFLIEQRGLQPKSVHFIGHSLGGQMCSYVAKEIPGIGRLTALDPAQIVSEGQDARVRVDKSDAEFVEVIHTDPRPFTLGMIAPYGHVDFYFNGLSQPGCMIPDQMRRIANYPDLLLAPIIYFVETLVCNHNRAVRYLVEAYNKSSNCIFWGHKLNLPNAALSAGNSLTRGLFAVFKVHPERCTPLNCLRFGIDTVNTTLRGVFLITTNNKAPYCVNEPGYLEHSPDDDPILT